jgi:hypothetical protein
MNLASKVLPTIGIRRSSAALTGIVSLVCVTIPLAACSSSKSPAGSGTAGNIMLNDDNNYSSHSTLTLNTIDTKAATEQDICWTGLTQDLQCHNVDPLADIDNVSLIRFQKTHEEVQQMLISGGEFDQSQVDVYRQRHADHQSTCAKLSEFTSIDNKPINIAQDFAEGTTYTYVLIAATTFTPAVGSATMVFVHPLDAADVAPLDIPIGCNLLTVDADLHTLTKVVMPTQGPWVVDWSHITKYGTGPTAAFGDFEYLDLTIGFSQNKTVADLEKNFFDIETSATRLWHVGNINSGAGAHSADLSLATDAEGNAFTGFNQQDGVWAIALRCPTCQNPMPLVLTIVDIGGDQ